MPAEHATPPEELYERALGLFEGLGRSDRVLLYGDGDPDGMTAAACASQVLDERGCRYDAVFTRSPLSRKDAERVAKGGYSKVYCTDFWEVYESPVDVVADMVAAVEGFVVYDHHDIRTAGRENLERLYRELDRRGVRDRFTLINPNLEGVRDVPNGSAWEYGVAERYAERHPGSSIGSKLPALREVATAGAVLDYCASLSPDLVARTLLEHPDALSFDRRDLEEALDAYVRAPPGGRGAAREALKAALPTQKDLLGSAFGVAGSNMYSSYIAAGGKGAHAAYEAARSVAAGEGTFGDLVEDTGRFPAFFANVSRVAEELDTQYARFEADLASHRRGGPTVSTEFDDDLGLALFRYSSDRPLRLDSHLSNNLRDRHPELAWVVYSLDEERGVASASLRIDADRFPSYDLASAVAEAVRGIDGANGGGHRVASGASVPTSELGTFLERIKEELRRQKGP